MALSNIFREPRREITESAVGTVVAVGLLAADYRFGWWFQEALQSSGAHGPGYYDGVWILGMVIGLLTIIAAYPVFFIFPHFVGETICDFLADRGIELRPKRRR